MQKIAPRRGKGQPKAVDGRAAFLKKKPEPELRTYEDVFQYALSRVRKGRRLPDSCDDFENEQYA